MQEHTHIENYHTTAAARQRVQALRLTGYRAWATLDRDATTARDLFAFRTRVIWCEPLLGTDAD